MADIIRETDEYVRYDIDFDEIVDAAQQVEEAAEGYDDLNDRLDDMDDSIAQAQQGIHFKGFVNYYSDLPNSPMENDAYTVLYSGTSGTDPDGTEYVWSNHGGTMEWNPWGKQTYSQSQIDTFLSAKQDTVTAGTGLAFGTGAAANTLGHSNTVTAKSTQGFAQIAYDAQGHITGSTAATTAQTNAINSGIDSTKVAQIETNKTNILLNWSDGKNLFDPTQQSTSGTGYTVIRNADNTITVTATGTNSQQFFTFGTFTPSVTGTYLFTSGKVGSSSTCGIYIKIGNDYYWADTLEGEGLQLSLVAGTTYTMTCRLSANQTGTWNFEPMIRSQGDSAYQPYAMSNVDLTTLSKQNQTNISTITPIVSTVEHTATQTANYEQVTGLTYTLAAGKTANFNVSAINQRGAIRGIKIATGTTLSDENTVAISETSANYRALTCGGIYTNTGSSDLTLYVFVKFYSAVKNAVTLSAYQV